MKPRLFKIISGFFILFFFYHAAEYMIVFKNSAAGFLVFQLLFFIAAWQIARWQWGRGLSAWGLDAKNGFLIHLLTGMFMGMLLYGLSFFLSILLESDKIKEVPDFNSIRAPLFLFIIGNFFSSFSEDILTRGYVFRHLNGKLTRVWIVLLSALIYVLNHIYRLDDGPQAWLYLFALGILFVLPLVITKRLWFTSGMHWAGNCIFFYTHEIIKTADGGGAIPFNYILIFCILLVIPINYWICKFVVPVKRSDNT